MYGGQDLIRVVATRALAPKKYIALVEVAGSVLTLGVSGENISCLDKTPLEEFRAAMENRPVPEPDSGFASRLRAMVGKQPTRAGEDDAS